MSIITSVDVGQQICDALGLNSANTQEVHIHIVEDDTNKEKEVCFKYGDHIQTPHPKTGEKLTIIYTPNVVDKDGYVYLTDWGYVHIANFYLKENDTNEEDAS